jgi:hypothetical protein
LPFLSTAIQRKILKQFSFFSASSVFRAYATLAAGKRVVKKDLSVFDVA